MKAQYPIIAPNCWGRSVRRLAGLATWLLLGVGLVGLRFVRHRVGVGLALNTVPRTAEGKARVVAANTKHGRRSRAYIERGRAINDELRQIILECQQAGLLP